MRARWSPVRFLLHPALQKIHVCFSGGPDETFPFQVGVTQEENPLAGATLRCGGVSSRHSLGTSFSASTHFFQHSYAVSEFINSDVGRHIVSSLTVVSLIDIFSFNSLISAIIICIDKSGSPQCRSFSVSLFAMMSTSLSCHPNFIKT